jgi:hypothetical protein
MSAIQSSKTSQLRILPLSLPSPARLDSSESFHSVPPAPNPNANGRRTIAGIYAMLFLYINFSTLILLKFTGTSLPIDLQPRARSDIADNSRGSRRRRRDSLSRQSTRGSALCRARSGGSQCTRFVFLC